MKNLVQIPLMLGFACLVAALFGAVHNQLSAGISPEYFLGFKYQQFGIAPGTALPIGAAVVGVLASWWMGVIIGLPIALITLLAPSDHAWWLFRRATLLVVVITAIFALGGLFLVIAAGDGALAISPFPDWPEPVQIAFVRAGGMHDASYIGGGVGLLLALILTFRRARRLAAAQRDG